jgi:hypothetical protein
LNSFPQRLYLRFANFGQLRGLRGLHLRTGPRKLRLVEPGIDLARRGICRAVLSAATVSGVCGVK